MKETRGYRRTLLAQEVHRMGYTQQSLAERLGVAVRCANRWIAGEDLIPESRIVEFAKALSMNRKTARYLAWDAFEHGATLAKHRARQEAVGATLQ